MAGFLYFHEGPSAPSLEAVRGWGLGYAFDKSPTNRNTSSGPAGGPGGYVFGDKARLGERGCKLAPADQRWRRIPGDHGLWLGYWLADPPTPDDLRRSEVLPGYRVKMPDGREWSIPLVRSCDEHGNPLSRLPCTYDLDDEGHLIDGEPLARHRWLWDITEWAWLKMVNDEDAGDQECLDTASRLLGANYAVHAIELVTMGVFSPQLGPAGVVALAVDYLTFRAWRESQKKTSPDSTTGGSPMSLGETDGTRPTGQPALIS